MIKNSKELEKFENQLIARRNLSYARKLKILDAMWEEAVALGIMPPKNPMEGIEVDIKIARMLNVCLKS